MIVDGFDLESPLVCEGVIGDGCGGGRIFYVEEERLFVYDPFTKSKRELLKNLQNVTSVTKKSCIIIVKTQSKIVEFDLSKLEE